MLARERDEYLNRTLLLIANSDMNKKLSFLALFMLCFFGTTAISYAQIHNIGGLTDISQLQSAPCDEDLSKELYLGDYMLLWDHFTNDSSSPLYLWNARFLSSNPSGYLLFNPTVTSH